MKNSEVLLAPNEGTLLYLRNHPSLAAKLLLDIQLNWVQRISIKAIWNVPFVMLILGRRVGKTYVGAVACVLRAMLFVGERILIVAPSKRQVDMIFLNEIIPLYERSDFFKGSVKGKVVVTTSYNRIVFTNGSIIEGFPVGFEGGKIRGAGCVTSDTYILTNMGLKKIINIYKDNLEYQVRTRFGLKQILVYAKNKKKKITKILTQRGYSLSGLPEHKLLVYSNNKKEYKYLSDCKIGDTVCLDIKDKWPELNYFDCTDFTIKSPRNCPKVTKANSENPISFPRYLNEDLASILGYLVSEGSYNQKTVVGMVNTDINVINDYCTKVEKVFNIKPRVRIISEGIDKRGIPRKTTYDVSINRTEIRSFLFNLGLKRAVAKTKEIPFSILESPRSVVFSFLKALFEGDGHARIDDGKYSVGYTTISYNLAHTLHVLLSNFGIYGTLRTQDQRNKNIIHPIISKNLIYSVDLTGESAIKYGNMIGFITDKKNKIIKKSEVINNVHRLDHEDFYYDKIVLIESKEEDFTYDFNVEDEHSYISNGFVSHNCSFLWVDEYAQMSESVINLVFKPMLIVKKKDSFNRYLITSSAFYRWNHMYTLFQYYVIKSVLQPTKFFVANFNYEHLLLSKKLPVSFDMDIINEAKDTLTTTEYDMEYKACLTDKADIITFEGVKNIKDVKKNDLVLTHTGVYKPISKFYKRQIEENIIKLRPYYYKELEITKGHKVFVYKKDEGFQWVEAGNLDKSYYLVYPRTTSTVDTVFYMNEYNENYDYQTVDNKKYIYPKSKWTTQSSKDEYILKRKEIRKSKKIYKSSINNEIKFNADIARFFGYYLTDGSCGSRGRSCNIALNKTEIEYAIDIKKILKDNFNIDVKFYFTKDNCLTVVMNSRLFVNFIKSVCGGTSYTKKIPSFIYNSSYDIKKEFILGYLRGDGCVSNKSRFTVAFNSVNNTMIKDLKKLLLDIGIQSSYMKSKAHKTSYSENTIIYTLQLRGKSLHKFLFNENKTSLFYFEDSYYVYYKIKDIKEKYFKGYVYNFSVEDNESYVANYITVHNCFA
jgi:intein/homing endonuclease